MHSMTFRKLTVAATRYSISELVSVLPSRIQSFILNSIASGIRLINVNRVSIEDKNYSDFVLKRRVGFSWPAIALGNLVFRYRRVPVIVLYRQQWLDWEQQVSQVLGRSCQPIENNQLAIEKLTGRPLGQCLKQQSSVDEKLIMIFAASRALWNLHQQSVAVWQLSHGDASVQNVLIDQETNTAQWFDFDLKHIESTKPLQRHADDLRALLFTTAIQFDPDSIAQLVSVVRKSYDSTETWQALQKQITARSFSIDLFHRAQLRRANLPPAISMNLIRAIELKVIETIATNAKEKHFPVNKDSASIEN